MIRNIAANVQAFTSNAFLVDGDRTVLVDTGSNFDAVSRVEEAVGDLDAVIVTHTHPDHVGTLDAVTEAFDVEAFGFDPDQPGVDVGIEDEAVVTIGDDDYRALHTPGHKDDHLCFYSESADILFAGDLVFQNGSFGRTDLEEGDRAALIQSIDRVLDAVDEDLREMHVGHGPSVTTNPYHDIELASQAARIR
ncbi:beta-lactamase domain protein [Haladaptatus paucihalophilus DX253]|uniref:Beta-lactamase domain protein n=1 Tax=Haladaptatus paucihalophilus DX253 TaxID=797209 RepID=E7QRM9_HALPU|nr:MBL fold metallo-hydrolase [Haladaptatus paucihalophilus]EFW92648.1 beta-lactamase domain protein [Haladaptatus paucihalophilus DX253]SHK16766.1 Glyoxylase, beta-lactamase superfamily II [Haladaptatus paucihalophilus DX253]